MLQEEQTTSDSAAVVDKVAGAYASLKKSLMKRYCKCDLLVTNRRVLRNSWVPVYRPRIEYSAAGWRAIFAAEGERLESRR